MNGKFAIRVQADQGEEEWALVVCEAESWSLTLKPSQGDEITSAGKNAFDALRNLRREVEKDGILVCCNGARADVRPSPQSASYGAWMVYALPMWRPPTVRDLVLTFGYCPPSRVVSVEEQDAYWNRHLENRGNWMNFINPVWWIYFLTASWGRPRNVDPYRPPPLAGQE